MGVYQRRVRPKASKAGALRIFVASDLHLIASVDGDRNAPGAISGNRYFYTAGAKMADFVTQVNAEEPDLVLFLGDLVDSYDQDSLDLFNAHWNSIKPAIQKELTIGNHDLAGGTYNNLVDALGYSQRDEIAGSRFNQTFTITNGRSSAKVVMVDSNIGAGGSHTPMVQGEIQQAARDWIEVELSGAGESVALICSHHGPADKPDHFNAANAELFAGVARRVVAANPKIRLFSIYGHNHRAGSTSPVLDRSIVSRSVPPVVDYYEGKYMVVYVYPNGSVEFELRRLKYS